jgi:hypothetical protein
MKVATLPSLEDKCRGGIYCLHLCSKCKQEHSISLAYPGFFFGEGFNKFSWGQGRQNGDLVAVAPIVRGFTQFVNEWNSYSAFVVTDVYSTKLGIWPSFFKISGGGLNPPGYASVHFYTRGIQNNPDWCSHLYCSRGSTHHRSQQTKLWILGSTVIYRRP